MTGLEAFAWATAAGLAVSLLDYAALAKVPPAKRRATFTDAPYLVKFFGHPIIGGLLAFLFQRSTNCFTPTLAFVAGAAAPSIVRTLVRTGAGLARSMFDDIPGRGQS